MIFFVQRHKKKSVESDAMPDPPAWTSSMRSRAGLVSGQAIVELMVAIGALTVGFMAMVGLLARSVSANRVVASNYTGTYLASEGIEVVKNVIDRNFVRILNGEEISWDDGLEEGTYEVEYGTDWETRPPLAVSGGNLRFLCFDSTQKLYVYGDINCTGNAATSFTREIEIVRVDADPDPAVVSIEEIAVTARVRWTTRGSGSFRVELEDHFFNWVSPPPEAPSL